MRASADAAAGLAWPHTVQEIRERIPTASEWVAEVALGFRSDGSTWSTDHVQGVRIGQTGTAYRPELPANLHDYRYRVIRRLVYCRHIDERTRVAMRHAADLAHWEDLRFRVRSLPTLRRWIAFRRCAVRYYMVRLTADRFTLPRSGESYPSVGDLGTASRLGTREDQPSSEYLRPAALV